MLNVRVIIFREFRFAAYGFGLDAEVGKGDYGIVLE